MTSRELADAISYANSLASTNPERSKIIVDLLEHAETDGMSDLDLNTLVWLLEGLQKAEKEGIRAPLKREHLISRDKHRSDMKPQVTIWNRSRIRDIRGINAASETTSTEADSDDPDNWISSEGEVIHTEG